MTNLTETAVRIAFENAPQHFSLDERGLFTLRGYPVHENWLEKETLLSTLIEIRARANDQIRKLDDHVPMTNARALREVEAACGVLNRFLDEEHFLDKVWMTEDYRVEFKYDPYYDECVEPDAA